MTLEIAIQQLFDDSAPFCEYKFQTPNLTVASESSAVGLKKLKIRYGSEEVIIGWNHIYDPEVFAELRDVGSEVEIELIEGIEKLYDCEDMKLDELEAFFSRAKSIVFKKPEEYSRLFRKLELAGEQLYLYNKFNHRSPMEGMAIQPAMVYCSWYMNLLMNIFWSDLISRTEERGFQLDKVDVVNPLEKRPPPLALNEKNGKVGFKPLPIRDQINAYYSLKKEDVYLAYIQMNPTGTVKIKSYMAERNFKPPNNPERMLKQMMDLSKEDHELSMARDTIYRPLFGMSASILEEGGVQILQDDFLNVFLKNIIEQSEKFEALGWQYMPPE